MNEASSKYVDQIATARLLHEKLLRVHHAPDPAALWADTSFADFGRLPHLPAEVVERRNGRSLEISFASAVATPYPENNRVLCRCLPASQPTGDLIFVHGLYEDNPQIYNFLIAMLNEQGLNVCSLTLPYHYERRPAGSMFSGEYFWSADLQRSALAYKQAVYDLYQLYHHLGQRSSRPVTIAGFSMGGGIALSLAALTPLARVFVINPVCNIGELVWSSALFAPVRGDLEAAGVTLADVKTRYSAYEPLNAGPGQTIPAQISLARGLYDQINDPANYDRLIEKWHLPHVISYKAGHLNILRAPRLAADIARATLSPGAVIP